MSDNQTPLARYLAANSMTLESFAQTIGVSKVAVHQWVHGRVTPTVTHAKAVEHVTNGEVTAIEMVFGEAPGAKAVEKVIEGGKP